MPTGQGALPRTVFTHCRICAQACGLEVTVDGATNQVVRIAPDKENPQTWRDFCAKARTATQVVEHPRRIRTPMRRVGNRYEPATYEEAVSEIAHRLREIADRHGPDAIASYHGNPASFSLSNSIFYVGLLDAIGTGNRFGVGSIDQNSLHVVSDLLYGSVLLNLVPDVDECRCFLLVGTNPAESAMNWTEAVPDGWRRILRAQAAGADLIVVDPRRTKTAERADTHVAVRPGQDWAFLLAVLKVIFDERLDRPASAVPLEGVDEIRGLAARGDLVDLATRCGVPQEVVRDVARRFGRATAAMCVTRTGVSQTATGTIGEWLGHVLNAVTDRLDVPGGRRFQRGAVNLVSMLDRVWGGEGTTHRTRLRGRPQVAGYHAIAELPDEITTPGPGQVRALLVNSGNPVVAGPDGQALDRALRELELYVAVDLVQRESHRHAHWLIPGAHWLEREELHLVLNSIQDMPYVQLARQAVPPPPGVRDEWEFFVDLALAMRAPLFGRRGVNTLTRVSREVARRFRRPNLALGPRWVERGMLAYGRRVKWRDVLAHPHGLVFGPKDYGQLRHHLPTPHRTVRIAPAQLLAEASRLLDEPFAPDPDFPFLLVNRRRSDSMNSWLNEAPGLHKHGRTNGLEVNPEDAEVLGVVDGQPVEVASAVAALTATASVSAAVSRGVVSMEHGWGSRVFDPHGASDPVVHGVNRNLLISNRDADPLSQASPLNATPVRVTPIAASPG